MKEAKLGCNRNRDYMYTRELSSGEQGVEERERRKQICTTNLFGAELYFPTNLRSLQLMEGWDVQ